jgi:aminopeptidase
MNKNRLKQYANLLIKKGINVQKGQDVIIMADLDQPEFVELCVKEAYKAGAALVKVEWNYPAINKITTNKANFKRLCEFTEIEAAKWQYKVDKMPCLLYLESSDPDALKGVNQERSTKIRSEKFKFIKTYRDQIDNKYQWCIAAVPGAAWAKKVFPGCNKAQAIEKMWEAILYTSKVDEDPCLAWDNHNKTLAEKCGYLNSLKLKTLHYTASNGTDLTVGLLPNVLWMGGGEHAQLSRIYFNPNIPSEECFTSPKKGEAEGIVYSSKPLSYNGEIIDKFWIRFKGGKAVEWGAEQNADLLGKMLTIDENAGYLGECALIPFDSPINNTGILFYNTLFDENASCHLAIGRGFTNLVEGYENYTTQELIDMGINYSLTHVDFMIGTADLCIEAETYDGKKVTIFKDGNWAF